ncbi:hypothetical protein FRAHR75_290007 [Frankia sp. Hr75.2]|nr:hypothetical protein FRAHR75_290007 [Frankia sp. Hr75.2]
MSEWKNSTPCSCNDRSSTDATSSPWATWTSTPWTIAPMFPVTFSNLILPTVESLCAGVVSTPMDTDLL